MGQKNPDWLALLETMEQPPGPSQAFWYENFHPFAHECVLYFQSELLEDGGETEDRCFRLGILPSQTVYRDFLAKSLKEPIKAVEEFKKALLELDEDYVQEIKDTRYRKLEGMKAGDHVRRCLANPDGDRVFVEDLADLLAWCSRCEAYPALWNMVRDLEASLKHLKEHERERPGYKQLTMIIQEAKIIQPRPVAPVLGKISDL